MAEREEIEMLLPWFVTGKLDTAERRRVEAYLAAHPDMARQVAVAREENAEVVLGAERLGAPSRASYDRLIAEVARRPKRKAALMHAVGAFLEQVADWIGGFSRLQLGGLAVAAALLVAVQAASLVYLASGDSRTYHTASGPADEPLGRGTFALVSFKSTATAGEITAALSELGAQVVDGPKAGGIWRVRLNAEPLPDADAEARLAALRAKDTVVGFASLIQ